MRAVTTPLGLVAACTLAGAPLSCGGPKQYRCTCDVVCIVIHRDAWHGKVCLPEDAVKEDGPADKEAANVKCGREVDDDAQWVDCGDPHCGECDCAEIGHCDAEDEDPY